MVLDADERQRQCPRETAKAWIANKRTDQGAGLPQPLRQARDIGGRPKQQPLREKNSLSAHILDRMENLRLCRQLLRQRGAGLGGEFGGRGIDDHQGGAEVSRKQFFELQFALAPIEVGRNELVDVGIDREMPDRVGRGGRRRAQPQDNDKPRESGTDSDDGADG